MFLYFVLTDKAHAQRCLPGTKGLRITAGMTDGFHTADKRNELGYHFGMGMDRYVNGCHKWVFSGEYLHTRTYVSRFPNSLRKAAIIIISFRMPTRCFSAMPAVRCWRDMKP